MDSKTWAGWTLVGIGLLHQAAGVVLSLGIFGDVVADGWVNAWADGGAREATFWFLISGFAFLVIAGLVLALDRIPRWLPAGLAGVALFGALGYPVSGMWLFFIPAALLHRHSRRAGQMAS